MDVITLGRVWGDTDDVLPITEATIAIDGKLLWVQLDLISREAAAVAYFSRLDEAVPSAWGDERAQQLDVVMNRERRMEMDDIAKARLANALSGLQLSEDAGKLIGRIHDMHQRALRTLGPEEWAEYQETVRQKEGQRTMFDLFSEESADEQRDMMDIIRERDEENL